MLYNIVIVQYNGVQKEKKEVNEKMDNKNVFTKGLTDFLILSILEKKDSYVYEIVGDISELSDKMIPISRNTFYSAIYKLEENSFITSYSKLVGRKRTRIYYHIEPKGKNLLKQLSNDYSNTVEGVSRIFSRINKKESNSNDNG